MSVSSTGEKLKVSLFGTSHGPSVGCVIEGFPEGMAVDMKAVNAFMERRSPGRDSISSQRKEADIPEILSGISSEGKTDGTPIRAEIKNSDARSKDYPDLRVTPRPGHADLAAVLKYGDLWDYPGGGSFSARLTAPLCFAGALSLQWLAGRGIKISSHIARIGDVCDAVPDFLHPSLPLYPEGSFPVIDPARGEEMRKAVEEVRQKGDSIGGDIRCVVTGLPAGLGGPYFEGIEGILAKALFGIPAVKSLSFGEIKKLGSENNDQYCLDSSLPSGVGALSNNSGGILGGISSGLPLYFTLGFKPTPSIALSQRTVDLKEMKETEISLKGRHDPCVVPRAVPVTEAVTALALMDIMLRN